MQYQQFSPPLDLAQWVECVWVLRGAVAPEGQTILPDGRMELVFHFGSPPATAAGPQPEALIAGQMISALHLTPRGDMDALGVRLQPAAGACLSPSVLLTGTLIKAAAAGLGGQVDAGQDAGVMRRGRVHADVLFA